MKGFILLALAVFAALQTVDSDCGLCKTMKWANCLVAAPSCTCILPLDENNMQPIDCEKLVSKCFLMKAEMYRRRTGQDVRLNIGGKPNEDAIVDNDGIYDPECETNGKFKAKQCNRTEECWCVNSAGVRRTDKGDKNMNCSKLVETHMIHIELKHKEVNSKVEEAALKTSAKNLLQTRYQVNG